MYCLNEMQKSSEGQRILKEKPRINTSTVDLSVLKDLPEGTLGKTYSNFLEVNVRLLYLLLSYYLKHLIVLSSKTI